MCNQLALKAQQKAQSEEWAVLHASDDDKGVPAVVEMFLKEKLMSLAEKEVEHYNENQELGEAIQEAVLLADVLDGWPQGLHELSGLMRVKVEGLVRSAEPFLLPTQTKVTKEVTEGICALMWARPTLEITLDHCDAGPESLATLASALRPTVKSLSLKSSNIAKTGNDLRGVRQLCLALKDERCCGLLTFDLDSNELKDAEELLAQGLEMNNSITSVRRRYCFPYTPSSFSQSCGQQTYQPGPAHGGPFVDKNPAAQVTCLIAIAFSHTKYGSDPPVSCACFSHGCSFELWQSRQQQTED
eukprot:2475317-Prymnesium_polylepis.1